MHVSVRATANRIRHSRTRLRGDSNSRAVMFYLRGAATGGEEGEGRGGDVEESVPPKDVTESTHGELLLI